MFIGNFGSLIKLSRNFGAILILIIMRIHTAFAAGQIPAITDINPADGKPGELITIAGQNFGVTPSENVVFFGGVRSIVKQASATELRVEVPPGVQSGPVTVTCGGRTAMSPIPFSPRFAPFGVGTNSCYAFARSLRDLPS
jgi:hypothetical protein